MALRDFWLKILEALSTVIGLCLIALAHRLLEVTLAFSLRGGWTKYHHLVESVTFVVFAAIYVFLLIEILELFWPSWLKRRPKP